VYGLGFGVQLGFGVVTVVTASATYAMLVAGVLTSSVVGGAIIGAIFGFVRGATLLAGGWVRRPHHLEELEAGLRLIAPRARAVGVGAQAILAGLLIAVSV